MYYLYSRIYTWNSNRFNTQPLLSLTPLPLSSSATYTLSAGTSNTGGGILHVWSQNTVSAQNCLHESLRNNSGAFGAGMCVIDWVESIDLRLSKTDVLVGEVLSMVDEACTATGIRDDLFSVSSEAGCCVCASGSFADVVWCWGRDDDLCALGDECLCGVGEVRNVGLDDDTGGCGASLGAGAIAIGSEVIGCGEGSAVVVTEFNDNIVPSDDLVYERCEASFVGVRACRTATDGRVDNIGVLDGVWEEDTPS